jgi:hypothetical protein
MPATRAANTLTDAGSVDNTVTGNTTSAVKSIGNASRSVTAGSAVGTGVGAPVDVLEDLLRVGPTVGKEVARNVLLGALLGCWVGRRVGCTVGARVGCFVGARVGARVGCLVGARVGAFVGRCSVGPGVGGRVRKPKNQLGASVGRLGGKVRVWMAGGRVKNTCVRRSVGRGEGVFVGGTVGL